jgi:hypothetical protein
MDRPVVVRLISLDQMDEDTEKCEIEAMPVVRSVSFHEGQKTHKAGYRDKVGLLTIHFFNTERTHVFHVLVEFMITGEARPKENTYKWVSCNERLNTKTE